MNLIIHCDGGSRGNPGPSACAFVAKDDTGNLQEKRGKYLGIGTNNEAEYMAVVEAWKWLEELGAREKGLVVKFHLDSNLVVNQINGNFKVREPRLLKLLLSVKAGENESGIKASYDYVPREKNAEADKLVNETLDKAKNIKA